MKHASPMCTTHGPVEARCWYTVWQVSLALSAATAALVKQTTCRWWRCLLGHPPACQFLATRCHWPAPRFALNCRCAVFGYRSSGAYYGTQVLLRLLLPFLLLFILLFILLFLFLFLISVHNPALTIPMHPSLHRHLQSVDHHIGVRTPTCVHLRMRLHCWPCKTSAQKTVWTHVAATHCAHSPCCRVCRVTQWFTQMGAWLSVWWDAGPLKS